MAPTASSMEWKRRGSTSFANGNGRLIPGSLGASSKQPSGIWAFISVSRRLTAGSKVGRRGRVGGEVGMNVWRLYREGRQSPTHPFMYLYFIWHKNGFARKLNREFHWGLTLSEILELKTCDESTFPRHFHRLHDKNICCFSTAANMVESLWDCNWRDLWTTKYVHSDNSKIATQD